MSGKVRQADSRVYIMGVYDLTWYTLISDGMFKRYPLLPIIIDVCFNHETLDIEAFRASAILNVLFVRSDNSIKESRCYSVFVTV